MKIIYVYENWLSDVPTLIGKLYVDDIRGSEIYSFEYDKKWLSSTDAMLLDPDLDLYEGRQYPKNKSIFGMFSDSSPDRWGRLLMKRRERINADRENRKPRNLKESDFLLGVFDETRMGGLRFSLEEGGEFTSNDFSTPTPPWTSIRTLEEAAREFEKDDKGCNNKWLNQLLKPGSSLGGARPKANVVDPGGNLWIAKFPSKYDEDDVGAWEKVAHDLARLCGLNVPESKLEKFSKLGSTFLVKRFDRNGNRRIHFSSAMTMLGKEDGSGASDGVGYLDIAGFIKAYGASPEEDLKELWKRIVFNMAISNTDDHLRNHGFLLTKKGWRLSPLYDINPIEDGEDLSLNVSEADNRISIDLAIQTAKFYGINDKNARGIADEIKSIVLNNWESLAKKYGISRSEIENKKTAFLECYK